MYQYGENEELYKQLCNTEIPKNADMDSVIDILVDVSKKKHEIQLSNNKLIAENITYYEKHPELIDDEIANKLDGFRSAVRGHSINTLGDMQIYLAICRILLNYYTQKNDYSRMVTYLFYILYCSNNNIDYAKTYGEPEGYELIGVLKDNYDKMDDDGRHGFVKAYFAWVYNTGDMQNAPNRYIEVCRFVDEHNIDVMADDQLRSAYVSGAIDAGWQICEYFGNEKPDFTEAELENIEVVHDILQELHERKLTGIVASRAEAVLYELEFVLGHIEADELISKLRKMFINRHYDDTVYGVPTRTYYIPSEMLDVIWKYTDYSKNTKIKKSEEILNAVFNIMKENIIDERVTLYTTDSAQLIMTASKHLGFERMRDYVLEMTIYADKALYIHTLMVKEIAQVILKEIMDSEPWYLVGVAGMEEEYIKYNPGEVMSLMEQCALFHDIGKHFCIDIVSNSSRNLTDEEFGIIKHHPVNFDIFFPKEKYEWFKCIRDSARLHHTWYNGKGGYPVEAHTNNQPFVNIISIADSIDAATDIIGRPYTTGKTLQMLIEEFDTFRDTRYSAFIIDVCKRPKVTSKINNLISNGRKKINYEIMTDRKKKIG